MGLFELFKKAGKKQGEEKNTQNLAAIAEFNGYKNKMVYAKEQMQRFNEYEEHKEAEDYLKFKEYMNKLRTVAESIRQIEYRVANGEDIQPYMEALKQLENEAELIRNYADTLGNELPSEGRTKQYVLTEDRLEGRQQRQFNSLAKSTGKKCDYGMKYLSEEESMFITQAQAMYIRIKMAISIGNGKAAVKRLDIQVLTNTDISTLRELAYEMNLKSKDTMVNLYEAMQALITSDEYPKNVIKNIHDMDKYFLKEHTQYRILYKTLRDLIQAGQEKAKLSTITRNFLETYSEIILRQKVSRDSPVMREYAENIMSKILS